MIDDEVIYPGKTARLTANFAGIGNNPQVIGPTQAASVTISVIDPLGIVVTPTTAMSWDVTDGLWTYLWTAPANGANTMYRYTVTLLALDGTTIPAYGEVWVEAPPSNPVAVGGAQPLGIPPVTRTYMEPWCDESDIPPNRLKDSNGTTIADLNMGWMISAATNLLYVLSGRKFRSGRSVVRPSILGRRLNPAPLLYPYNTIGFGDAWGYESSWLWTQLGGMWAWGQGSTEILLTAPVRRINRVICDGTTLAATQYVVYDGRRLVRTDGGVWPTSQTETQALSEAGTLQVDYEWGNQPKDDGRLACAELAIELALSFSGQDNAKLPARVTSVATQGVSVGMGSSLDFLREQLSGLPTVDLFLQAHNPMKRRKRSVFMSPESVLNRAT